MSMSYDVKYIHQPSRHTLVDCNVHRLQNPKSVFNWGAERLRLQKFTFPVFFLSSRLLDTGRVKSYGKGMKYNERCRYDTVWWSTLQ